MEVDWSWWVELGGRGFIAAAKERERERECVCVCVKGVSQISPDVMFLLTGGGGGVSSP